MTLNYGILREMDSWNIRGCRTTIALVTVCAALLPQRSSGQSVDARANTALRQVSSALVPATPTQKLSFNQSIQPILSENCYPCHGPDPGARKAKMRLDRAEFAYAPHDKSGPAIIPGQPDKSPLVRKIEAKIPKDRMPPPEAHKTLKPEQIASLREWVRQGAVYE